MKKTLKSGISILLCFTFALAVMAISPLRSSAAGTGQLQFSIEGAASTVYSGEVPFTPGQSVADILQNLYLQGLIGQPQISGGFLNQIGDGTGPHDDVPYLDPSDPNANSDLSFYVNDVLSDQGITAVHPSDGDSVVIALTGYSFNTTTYAFSTFTKYPLVSLSPQNPQPGQSVTVTVTDADTGTSIDGANVSIGSSSGTTAADGTATLTMPSDAGTYGLQVSEENTNSGLNGGYPYLVRRSIPVTVAATPPAARTIDTADTDRTVDLGSGTVTSLDVTGGPADIKTESIGTGSGLIPGALNATFRDGYNDFTVAFPAGTAVTGSSWSGAITLSHPATGVTVPHGGAVSLAAGVGSSVNLTLSNYARITLPGESGTLAGYDDASGSFHAITTRLLTDSIPSGFSGEDAYYDDGYNLIIYTRHLSTFIAYTASQGADSSLAANIAGAASYLAKNDSSDWSAFALARAGSPVPSGYLPGVAAELKQDAGNLGGPASLAKTVIALRAAGANPQSFDGYNLVESLYNYQGLQNSGLNGPIYALLALDGGGYTPPSSALWDSQKLVSYILGCQNAGGSFSLTTGSAGDPDITAMAITALAPHLKEAGVADAVNAALGFLSSVQTGNGGFIPSGGSQEASETASQVVIALSSVNLDPSSDSRFVKNGNSVLSDLLSYKNSNGGFRHIAGGGTDIIATQQALMALDAYSRYELHEPLLFDLTGTGDPITTVNPQTGSSGVTPALAVASCSLILLAALRLKRRRRPESDEASLH